MLSLAPPIPLSLSLPLPLSLSLSEFWIQHIQALVLISQVPIRSFKANKNLG
jgi:hypothetical protein